MHNAVASSVSFLFIAATGELQGPKVLSQPKTKKEKGLRFLRVLF
jgi:hypothetical protein